MKPDVPPAYTAPTRRQLRGANSDAMLPQIAHGADDIAALRAEGVI